MHHRLYSTDAFQLQFSCRLLVRAITYSLLMFNNKYVVVMYSESQRCSQLLLINSQNLMI